MKNLFLVSAAVSGLVALSSVPASAQFGSALGSMLGASQSNSPATTSTDDLRNNLSSLNRQFGKAMQQMLRAQGLTLAALGEKDKADQLSAEADSLEGKDDINVVARSITVSQEASSECDSKMNSASALDDHGKALLAAAKPHYDQGRLESLKLAVEYARWVVDAQATARGMGANPVSFLNGGFNLAGRISDVITVTGHLPGLKKAWDTTSDNFDKFTKANKIDTSNLASKL